MKYSFKPHCNFYAPLMIVMISLIVSVHAQNDRPKDQIPSASVTSSDEVKQWWETVRLAGAEAAKALERKESAIKARRNGASHIPDDEEELLSKKDREKLNTALAMAIQKYLAALQEGKEKSYRVPISDGRPIILGKAHARFNNAARDAKVNGIVVVSVVFQEDGNIGDPRIVRGIGFGLDEKSIEAARKIVFLPAVKNGSFVSIRSMMEFTFSIY